MGAQGTTTIDFGSGTGKQTASIAVTGQGTILSGSQCEAWIMYTSSASHNETEHLMVPMNLRCGTVIAGTGFTIYAASEWSLTGTFTLQWVWN